MYIWRVFGTLEGCHEYIRDMLSACDSCGQYHEHIWGVKVIGEQYVNIEGSHNSCGELTDNAIFSIQDVSKKLAKVRT